MIDKGKSVQNDITLYKHVLVVFEYFAAALNYVDIKPEVGLLLERSSATRDHTKWRREKVLVSIDFVMQRGMGKVE